MVEISAVAESDRAGLVVGPSRVGWLLACSESTTLVISGGEVLDQYFLLDQV